MLMLMLSLVSVASLSGLFIYFLMILVGACLDD